MRVLIVEDDKFYAQRLMELFQDHQIDVELVESVEQALQSEIDTFDAAIIDLMLPNDPSISGITDEESRGGFLSGIGLARRLLRRSPSIRLALLSSQITGGEAEQWATENGIPFIRKYDGHTAVLSALDRMGVTQSPRTPRAFIVHGHDEVALAELKDYLRSVLKWQDPIVLREKPNGGRTLIEKFEQFGLQVDCVFVLLTPDDNAVSTEATDDEKRRSRQNVIFELGFFYGVLGRQSRRVVLLHKGPLELPSDLAGIVWIDVSDGIRAAGEDIRKELAWLV